MTSDSQFPGLQHKPANGPVMFCAGYPNPEAFPILLTESSSPSKAAAGSGFPSKVHAMGPAMRSGFPALPTGSSHFGKTVMGRYPEMALKRFCLLGTARVQE